MADESRPSRTGEVMKHSEPPRPSKPVVRPLLRAKFVFEVRWTEVDLKGKKVERVKEFASTMEFLAREDANRFADEKRAVGYTPTVENTSKPWSPSALAARASSPSIPPKAGT